MIRRALVVLVVIGAFVVGLLLPYRLPVLADNLYRPLRSIGHNANAPVQNAVVTAVHPPLAQMEADLVTASGDSPDGGDVLVGMRSQFPAYPQRVVEFDRRGKVVWEFRTAPYDEHGFLSINDVRKLPNGDVLFGLGHFINDDLGVPSSALRSKVMEVDMRGNVVHQADLPVSHHAEVLPVSGHLLLVDARRALVEEVDWAGKVYWSWDGYHAFPAYTPANFKGLLPAYNIDNEYRARLERPDISQADWFHVNSAQRLDNGNTVISIRNFDLVVEVNQAGQTVWSYGPNVLKHQHCPFVIQPGLPGAGHLLVVDNGNARVLEVDRQTQQIVWSYDKGLELPIQACAYRLPSGDTLITDSGHLRAIEVNPAGAVTWELDVKTAGTQALYRVAWAPPAAGH